MTACGVQKQAANNAWSKVKEASKPAWHTCVIPGAKAVVTTNEERISAAVTMQVVHDSLIIISIMPTLGIEMARLEATPAELVAFDKVHNRYAATTYEELNQRLRPKISWQQLQQICSAELPTGDKTAKLVYSIGKEHITFDIRYAPRKLDIPVKTNRLNIRKYRKMDISQWL
jgi:hypothetical protein